MLIDIAVNITDKQFKKDYKEVILECKENGVLPIFVGTDVDSSIESLNLAKEFKTLCYAGIHPTSEGNFEEIIPLYKEERVIAVGECGLDYDRLNFTTKESQKKNFLNHLNYEGGCYFFHCRNSQKDFLEMVKTQKGVVHSFTGSVKEGLELVERGFFVGINGCSLKTEEGIEVVRRLPLESILLETDAPYCKIRKSSPSYSLIKTKEREKLWLRRNVPLTVKQVAECVAEIKEVSYEEVERITVENTARCFGEKIYAAMKEFFA